MLRHRHQFILRNCLLYRKIQLCSCDQPSLQFVLPQNYTQAMKACHDDIGHLVSERSLDLLKDRFYWAGMTTDMENHIQTYDRCLCYKCKPRKQRYIPLLPLICYNWSTWTCLLLNQVKQQGCEHTSGHWSLH